MTLTIPDIFLFLSPSLSLSELAFSCVSLFIYSWIWSEFLCFSVLEFVALGSRLWGDSPDWGHGGTARGHDI